MKINLSDSKINLLNSPQIAPSQKILGDYLKKFYNSPAKGNHKVSRSMNLQTSNLSTPRIDESLVSKLDELSKLSKMFSDKMKIVDARDINEINTSDKWKKLNLARSSLMRNLGSKKNTKNLRFSFSDHQKEFESNWLTSLKDITGEKQLQIASILLNGGYNDKELTNCPYLIENEVKKLEEKATKKGKYRIREKFNKTITQFSRRSLINDLEEKNSELSHYCDCNISHKVNKKCKPKNYKSIIGRSRPISPKKFIEGLREKLNLRKKVENSSENLDIFTSPRFEEISFMNTDREGLAKAKTLKLSEKYPLPSITHLENLFRSKWNKTKSLNSKTLLSISKHKKKTIDEIIKENEKAAFKILKRKIGYMSQTVLKSEKILQI